MRVNISIISALVVLATVAFSCKKNESSGDPQMKFSLKFDPNQVRLNNIGQPAVMPAGHAAQTPEFREMSVHYIELAPSAFTQLGDGAIVYHAPETAAGGENAVDFDQAAKGGKRRSDRSTRLVQRAPRHLPMDQSQRDVPKLRRAV